MPRSKSVHPLLLLCVDVQPVFLASLPKKGATLLQRCGFAVSCADGLGIPVFFTEQVPQKLGATAPELLERCVTSPSRQWSKSTFSALADEAVSEAIKSLGVEHILLCGLETPVCIYQTALDALGASYQVTLLSDAVGARRPDDAATCLSALVRAGAHVLPSETVFYAWLHNTAHPFFKSYTQLVKAHA